LFHARRSATGTKMAKTEFENLKGVEWNSSGQDDTNGDHRWPIEYQIPTATSNKGELGTRSFQQFDPAKLAGIFYYSHEVTGAMSKRDLDLRKNDDTKMFDLEVQRDKGCEAALKTLFRKYIWNTTETLQNGGLSHIVNTTNVSGTGTYAGLPMQTTSAYWTPGNYVYTAYTFTSNLMRVLSAGKIGLTRSDNAGGGNIIEPDFCCFSPAAWYNVLTFFEGKSTFANAGNLGSPMMYAEGFQNIWFCGMDLFYDNWFGGSASGFIESAAAEEAVMGHSDKAWLRTTQQQGEGLLRVLRENETPEVRGKVWVYETGMQMLKFESPIWFGLLYL